jgi:hypothetical protein
MLHLGMYLIVNILVRLKPLLFRDSPTKPSLCLLILKRGGEYFTQNDEFLISND